ncbi:DUF4466 family protein [Chitinophaga niabensis]|uniref:DUF4466 family protein n=1 Tax=Chitinophaga niabensis TaxID=536979 RepID=UPI0031B9E6D0
MSVKYFQYTLVLFSSLLLIAGCKDDKYETPQPKGILQNDVIKRSLGPNLVGQNIEFVYAMALPADKGKLVSATVEASIAGAPTTFLEHRSFYTNSGGIDVPVTIGAPSVNNGNSTVVTFSKDTMAAALRYFYVAPEAARGKSVKFTFTAKSSNGETATYSMGPYNISKVDMKLDLKPVDGAACYISIEDLAVYTAAEAAAKANVIDLVYLYRTTPVNFNHSIIAPGTTTPAYLQGITLPAGVNRKSKILKVWALRDQQLARAQFGVFIDDIDFQKLDLADATDFAVNLKAEAGIWVETADGKYRAYVYMNSVTNGTKTATISIKRYAMQ